MALLLLPLLLILRLFAAGPEPDPLLDIDALCRWLGIPKGTAYQWVHRNVGPRPIKAGRHLRWRRSEVERWLDEQTREAS